MSFRSLAVALIASMGCTGIVATPPIDAGASELDGGSTADAGAGCPTGQHHCGTQCVSDDAVDSCGDLCAPCSAPMGGSASCVARGTNDLKCK